MVTHSCNPTRRSGPTTSSAPPVSYSHLQSISCVPGSSGPWPAGFDLSLTCKLYTRVHVYCMCPHYSKTHGSHTGRRACLGSWSSKGRSKVGIQSLCLLPQPRLVEAERVAGMSWQVFLGRHQKQETVAGERGAQAEEEGLVMSKDARPPRPASR